MKKNIRFWTLINNDWVKIKIEPDRAIRVHSFSRDEEGYSSETKDWEYDGNALHYSYYTDSRDCDGRMSTHATYMCFTDEFGDLETEVNPYSPSGVTPSYRRVSSDQRDYSAEAAGY